MSTYKTIEEELETFTDEELRLWNKGYLAAIQGIVDQIQGDQIRILNKLLELEDTEKRRTKLELQSRLLVLDTYESHYKTRLLQLERDAE